MVKAAPPTQSDFNHVWYFREWMAMHGKIQADLTRDLDWSKAKASAVWHGQQYTQALLDEVAPWLNVKPYELLLPPEEAMAIRGMRGAAARIAHSNSISEEPGESDIPVRQKRA